MKKRILQPDQLFVPGEYEIGDESILRIYFRISDRGHIRDLPPSIVIHKDTVGLPYHGLDHPEFEPYKEYNAWLEKYLSENPNAVYFLLDGNHKSVAATLCHKPIATLELESDADINMGRKMVQTGELFNWNIPGKTLEETIQKLGDHIYGRRNRANFVTVSERVDKLTSNGDLPQYMKDRYLRGRQ